ncbi:MAG: HigA family addiction module antitoxin [Eubacteriales bacterium]|nr:HigA family addiction module antitoxin [Eubacteriales bacterium]
MSNYIEYNDKIAFHPGYYIKEIVEKSRLTQEDFAKRLDTTPKNLSLLLRGEQVLSIDMAMKLSRMLGTSINYWLNIQSAYDALIAQFKSEEELINEREIFKGIDYKYFKDNFGLPSLPRKIDEQIKHVREFLQVATISVFAKRNMAVSFRSSGEGLTESSIVKANVMVQIAMNTALSVKAPKFNRKKFEEAVKYALTLTQNHDEFYPLIKKAFQDAGVIFIILPNMPGSKTNGATKKIGDNILLMVNDRRLNADSFWFTLFHEIGHIVNEDYGISFEKEEGEREEVADRYAEDSLIPPDKYQEFLAGKKFDLQSIRCFSEQIERDPGIVLGRLQNDGIITFDNWTTKPLRHKYKVKISYC